MIASVGSMPGDPDSEKPPLPKKPVAVFVCHGMGQQAHFETIESVANALLREQGRREAGEPSKSVTRRLMARPPRADETSAPAIVELGGHRVVMGRVKLKRGGIEREVHIYEGYWAPLTEGRIGVWQVFAFLLSAARLGIWNCLRNRGFVRFMFYKKETFGGYHLAGLALLAILVYVIVLLLAGPVMLANAFTLVSVISLLFGKAGGAWVADPLISAGTWYVTWIETFLIGLGAAVVVLPKFYSWLLRKAQILRAFAWMLRWLCFVLAIVSLVGAGLVAWCAVSSFSHYAIQNATGLKPAGLELIQPWKVLPGFVWFHGLLASALRFVDGWVGMPDAYLRIASVWAVALLFGYFVRWFLIEFAGDVAIYTSSYKVSAFLEIRSKICQTVFDAARAVYQARDGDLKTGPFWYDDIFVVGHSLGSVIAYDTLNELIAEDLLSATPVKVAARTRFMLTFGSPLDKIAFVFRTHSSRTHDFREKAAEAVQPLIREYRFRPDRWVNLWSPMDIISGRLKYYDEIDPGEGAGQRVENLWDREAWVPFAAHTEYWQNRLLAQTLYEAVVRLPD
jgi:hypothetical protein